MTTIISMRWYLVALALLLGATPAVVGAQAIDDGSGDKLIPKADLDTVITETTYKSAELLKAKKAFSGWPKQWYITEDGQFVMPGDRVVPDGAPETFLKAKKAFDETGEDFEFVMPGDNVTEEEPDLITG